jgi:hypothetical protein
MTLVKFYPEWLDHSALTNETGSCSKFTFSGDGEKVIKEKKRLIWENLDYTNIHLTDKN